MHLDIASYSGIGKRIVNEDFILTNENNKFFVVCDGVGGQEKGEIASKAAAEHLNSFFSTHNIEGKTIVNVTRELENKFSSFISENKFSKGMATTIAFLKLNSDKSASVGFCGDTRVYQFRNSKIIFKTKDHSYVQELVDSGYLTEDEARKHPKKNIVTRALQGNDSPTSIEYHNNLTVLDNDVFLLCTDGVIEALSDDELISIMSDHNDMNCIGDNIISECNEKSQDNNSFIILKCKIENSVGSLDNQGTPNKYKSIILLILIIISIILLLKFFL